MLSETLATGLEHYKIGPKIRALRLKKSWAWCNSASTQGCRQACCPKSSGEHSFPRCRRYCELLSSSVSGWSISSLRARIDRRWL